MSKSEHVLQCHVVHRFLEHHFSSSVHVGVSKRTTHKFVEGLCKVNMIVVIIYVIIIFIIIIATVIVNNNLHLSVCRYNLIICPLHQNNVK